MRVAVFGLIGLGLMFVILSGVWSSLFPGTRTWTSEKAAEWSKIQVRLHNLAPIVNHPTGPRVSMHRGPEAGQAKQEYDRLTAEDKVFAAEFQSAHDSPYTIARVLKWCGISLALVGLIGWYAANQSS